MEADLGIDSIKRVEIMGVLHERFAAGAPAAGPEQLGELRTLQDIVSFVASGPAAGVTSAPAPAAAVSASVAGPSADEVSAALLDVVAGKTGYPAEMLELGMDVEADLGIDSIKRVEIMGVLHERFAAGAPAAGPEQLGELRTLQDIVSFIAGGPADATPAATAPAPAAAVSASVAGPSADEVSAALLDVVAGKTGYPAEMLELGMDVEADLGIDSIKRVEIMGVLHERFAAGAPAAGPEQLGELRTLQDIVSFIAGGPADATPAATAPAPAAAVSASVAGPSADEVSAALLDVVAGKTGYPAEMLELGMDVEADLGIDSIKRVEIMGVLHERFAAGAPAAGPEQLGELRTLQDIVSLIAGGPAEAAPAPATAPGAAATAVPAPVPADPEPPRIGRAQAALVTLPAPDELLAAYPESSAALLVDDGGELAPTLAARLQGQGWKVHVLRLPGVPQRVDGAVDHALTGWGVNELSARTGEIVTEGVSLVLDLCTKEPADWAEAVRRLAHTLLTAKHLVEPLTAGAANGRTAYTTVTRLDGAFGVTGVDEARTPLGGVAGLVKTLAVEAPRVFCRAVDLAPRLDADTAAELVLAETRDAATTPVQTGHDGTRRVTLTVGARAPHPEGAATEPVGPQDLLVVTGGARGITAVCVAELARRHRTGLLLLGRTPLVDEPAWARGVHDAAALKAAAVADLKAAGEKPTPKRVEEAYRTVTGCREIRETLEGLRAAGSDAHYLAVDITDPQAVAAALAPYRDRVTGLVHGAGVLADQLVAQKKASEIERVFAPKLTGLRAVTAALDEDTLRHVVLFSSVAGFFGNRGQSDYAMANETLNTWASAFKRRHPRARVTSLNWGAWDSGMVSPQIKAVFAERGIALIPRELGAELFAEQFAAAHADDVVTVLGPTTPLSEPDTAPATPVTVRRALAPLTGEAVLGDHVIGDAPVLPAALALGLAVGLAERVTGQEVRTVRDFAVHKGIVFDGTEPAALDVTLTPAPGEEGTVTAALRSETAGGPPRPHYAAVLDTTAAPQPAPLTGLPALGGGTAADGLYRDGTLFHGPSLRGLRRVLADEESRLVLECSLPEPPLADGAFSGHRYAPGAADLLLQAALVWVRRFRGTAGLPLSVGRAALHQPLPGSETFLVVVEPVAAPDGGPARLTVTACAPDGTVLTVWDEVSVISAPQLTDKFVGRPATETA
ncbi:polyunsaturated fatty acid synthase PfaA [Streptomyces sp. SPB074]|nr:polyunsaturated fatty acid synthase PfaA [Streptomyces sp. SPB074]